MEQQENVNNEIDLLDLVAVLLRKKWLILGITTITITIIILYSAISLILPSDKSYLPNEYTPKALMLINDSSTSGAGLTSMFSSSGLGSLASLAGINATGGSSYSNLAVYLAGTNSFLDAVVDKFNLIARYRIIKSIRAESRNVLKKKMNAQFDSNSGVFSISYTDIDPVFAQSVVNFSVKYFEDRFTEMGLDKNKLQKENLEVNIANTFNEIRRLETESQQLGRDISSGSSPKGIQSVVFEATRLSLELDAQKSVYTQLKTQYELLKVTMASEKPIFQVLEKAEVPDQKSGPSRGKLCIIVILTSFFASIFLSFVLNTVENIRKDPEVMAKLKGITK